MLRYIGKGHVGIGSLDFIEHIGNSAQQLPIIRVKNRLRTYSQQYLKPSNFVEVSTR